MQCVPNKTLGLGGVLDIIRAKINTVRGYEPGVLRGPLPLPCPPSVCYPQGTAQTDNNENGYGTCKIQWRALLTYNNDSYSGYVESGALLQCEMNMRYIEANTSVLHDSKEQRKRTHAECDWGTAYEAGTSCRTVQNGYEASTCSPTCRGFWDAQWSFRLELFADEGRWYDWDPAYCTAVSETVLTCGSRGSAYV